MTMNLNCMNNTLQNVDGNIWYNKQIIFKKISNTFVFRYGSSLFIIRKRINILHAFLPDLASKYLIYDYYAEPWTWHGFRAGDPHGNSGRCIGYFKTHAKNKKLKIYLKSASRKISEELDFEHFFVSSRQEFNIGPTRYHFQNKAIHLEKEGNTDELDFLISSFILWHCAYGNNVGN